MTTIKLTLKEIRQRKGYTQTEVAEKLGLNRTYYSNVENNKDFRNGVRVETMKRIADFLGVAIEDIL